MDLELLLGRFHPLLVHLPIGFLVLIVFTELYFSFVLKKKLNRKFSLFAWFLSFVGSVFAVLTGLLISSGGHYIEANLSIHKNFGLLLLGITFFGWLVRLIQFRIKKLSLLFLNVVSIVLLTITGHYGGNLTHGEAYLDDIIPISLNNDVEKNHQSLANKNIDSIALYYDLIHPIFSNKCISCHNNENQRGGLDMSNLEQLLKGGNAGKPIDPVNPRKSLLFNRITLPIHDIKSMPPDGELVSYDEINLILWWIANEKSSEKFLHSDLLTNEIKLVVKNLYNLDFDPKKWNERIVLDKLDEEELELLNKDTYKVNFISENQKFISLEFLKNEITQEDFEPLRKLNNHIVYLKFPGSSLNKNLFDNLENFKNLIRLDLKNNPFEDEDLSKLLSLKNLEVLNLIGTSISEKSIKTFNEFKNLKRVYLWNTKVNSVSIELFNQEQNNIELIGGVIN